MNYTAINQRGSKQSGIPSDLQQKISELVQHQRPDAQNDVLTKYVHWINQLPWEARTQDILDIKKAAETLEAHHYGLADVKRRVLEYLSVLILQKQQKNASTLHAPVLFFIGLAGTGKTSFAKSVALSLGRQFARIPFGGLANVNDLRGSSKVSPEAEPGLVMKALVACKSKNPVILLDELDRVTPEARAGIMGVLIELLDPEQNSHFIDHYIDYPFDLSEVIFIATANNSTGISTAVLDRLETIQMPSYSDDDKIIIGKKFILPRLLVESGLEDNSVTVSDEVWKHIARASGYDPGIRSVERKIETVVRRVAYKKVSGGGGSFDVNEGNMNEWIN